MFDMPLEGFGGIAVLAAPEILCGSQCLSKRAFDVIAERDRLLVLDDFDVVAASFAVLNMHRKWVRESW